MAARRHLRALPYTTSPTAPLNRIAPLKPDTARYPAINAVYSLSRSHVP